MFQKISKGKYEYVFGLFSRNDEFFHHLEKYRKYVNDDYLLIDDTHHISKTSIVRFIEPKISLEIEKK